MVAPVTGPYVTYPSNPYTDSFRRWRRQKPPYDIPLEFKFYEYYGKGVTGGSGGYSVGKQATLSSANFDKSRQQDHAYNVAYSRLQSMMGERSGWAETFAQINKTRSTINGRALQLARFVSALRRFDIKRAERILRSPAPYSVSRRKGVAQNWLEWQYGIAPVLNDFQNSMSTLVNTDFGFQFLKGRGKSSTYYNTHSYSSSPDGSWARANDVATAQVTVTCRTRARITNPNLFLANQLGILDTALPWKMIPFSFVVDWFINVEQVLSSVTDWYGVQLQYPHRTIFWKGSGLKTSSTWVKSSQYYSWSSLDRSFCEVDRIMGLPSPKLVMKPFKAWSIKRAANAIALVVSVLGK